jgi:hypothetical protein
MNGSLRTPGYRKVLEHYGYLVSVAPYSEKFLVVNDQFVLVATFTTYDDNVFRLGTIVGGTADVLTFVEFAWELAERAK